MQKKVKTRSPVHYLFIPLAFLAGIVLLGALLFGPVVSPYLGLASYFFSKTQQPQPASLFVGISESLAKNGEVLLEDIVYPGKGDMYGNIAIAGTSVDAPLYYGDATRQLNQGVGTYVDNGGAGIPGESKTILLGAHNNTFFNGLQDVAEGDEISIATHYGNYAYRVVSMRVADASDASTYDFSRSEENLILYTCYPFDALGLTPQRYFVYAELVSGPRLVSGAQQGGAHAA